MENNTLKNMNKKPTRESEISLLPTFIPNFRFDMYDEKVTFSTNVYRNLRIKVYGNGLNQLVGIPFLYRLCGRVLSHKILEKGLVTDLDRITIKLRRGLKITIYPK